ncbi:MAG: hypothetical protein HGA83_05750 [Bacteroidales bacterium]|nr:hypothetical protein [Bacteroidales bacterium]
MFLPTIANRAKDGDQVLTDVENRILNLFWIGFIIYTFAYTAASSEQVNYFLFNLIQVIGIAIFVPTALLLIRPEIDNKYLRVIFIIYCLWILGVMLRGFKVEKEFIKQMLLNAYEGIFLFIVPVIMLFPKNLYYIKKVFLIIIILGLIYLGLDLYFIRDLLVEYDLKNSQDMIEYFSKTLSIPCGFLLMTYMYHSKKVNLFALFIVGLTFILAIIRARRALAFIAACPVLVAYLIYYFHSKNKVLKVVFFILIVMLISIAVAYLQSILFYFSTSDMTGWFVDRVGQDSRSEVEMFFYRDLKPLDWIFGKGIDGHYYCPGISEGKGQISVFRSGIETDYLTTILKGGIISLGLQLIILIPAIVRGLFNSKNMLSKAAALWILLYLGDLYPAPVTTFTLNYMLVWISVGICYSRVLTNIPESEIVEFFNQKSKLKLLKPGVEEIH